MKYIPLSIFMILVIFPLPCFTQTSIYADKFWTAKIDTALHLIYNMEFDKAKAKTREVESHFGPHPAVDLLNAEIVFWGNRPLKPGTPPYKEYMRLLDDVIALTQKEFPDERYAMEKNFYLMSGYSLIAEQYAEDKDYWSVLAYARNAYKYMINGMGHEQDIPEYYFTTGLYNYYRIKYPELHPFYKSFTWFFMDGNKDLGIKYLKKASEQALFLKEQAYIYLFHIYMRYENDPATALPYAWDLVKMFPGNLHFMALYAEGLYYNNSFIQLNNYANLLASQNRAFYNIPGFLFKGLVAEHYNRLDEAKNYFNKSISLDVDHELEDDHYLAMDYAGLARIALRDKDLESAKDFYQLAEKTEPYVPVKAEAEAFFEKKVQ